MLQTRKAEERFMSVIQGYTQTVLDPQLRSLGLAKQQREIIVEDVTDRLESLLSRWPDARFRQTVLVLGTEEATFWEPQSASLEVRSLVVVAVRNSLVTDLNASRAYTPKLRSRRQLLPDERMRWLTSEAVSYFQAADLGGVRVQPGRDVFGSLPQRFPNAWHALSLLGNSADTELPCQLPMAAAEPMAFSASPRAVDHHSVVESGIDPGLDTFLAKVLRQIEQRQADLLFSFAFKGFTRNPEKLLSIIDHVL
jgi:hypothetical protein